MKRSPRPGMRTVPRIPSQSAYSTPPLLTSVPGRSAYTGAGAPAPSPGVPRLEPRAVSERRVRLGNSR